MYEERLQRGELKNSLLVSGIVSSLRSRRTQTVDLLGYLTPVKSRSVQTTIIRAEFYLSQVIFDHLSYFEQNRVRFFIY